MKGNQMSSQPVTYSYDFNRAISKTGELLRKLKDAGYTVVVSGCVGGVPAMASGVLMWRVLENHKKYIDAIRTSSGSGIPYALATTGMSSEEIERKLCALELRSFVEDIGLFAEHNQAKGLIGAVNDLIAYYVDAYNAGSVVVRNLTDYRGIIIGDLMCRELARNLTTNSFVDTFPKFEVVACRLKGFVPTVFSAETTPHVSISEAVTASSSIYQVFRPRRIDGVEYVDGAEYEAMPLRSIVDSHIRRGLNPEKLFILGLFVHRAPWRIPDRRHVLAMDEYRATFRHQDNFKDHLEDLRYDIRFRGVKYIMLEVDATDVSIPSPEPFPALWELGGTLRRIRKLFAKLMNKGQVERLLRGVSIFLYNELNPQHLPYYLDSFNKKLEKKLLDGISNFDSKFTL